MKNLVTVLGLTLLAAAQFSENASACSLQPTAYAQAGRVSTVLRSEEFNHALSVFVQSDSSVSIKNIDVSGTVNVRLSNDCIISGLLKYAAPEHPGLCPQFKGVTVEAMCEKNGASQ